MALLDPFDVPIPTIHYMLLNVDYDTLKDIKEEKWLGVLFNDTIYPFKFKIEKVGKRISDDENVYEFRYVEKQEISIIKLLKFLKLREINFLFPLLFRRKFLRVINIRGKNDVEKIKIYKKMKQNIVESNLTLVLPTFFFANSKEEAILKVAKVLKDKYKTPKMELSYYSILNKILKEKPELLFFDINASKDDVKIYEKFCEKFMNELLMLKKVKK